MPVLFKWNVKLQDFMVKKVKIGKIKNLSMEVNFMDSSDGLGRSKNDIGADIQVSIVLAGIVDSVRGRIHHRTVFRGTV